MIHLDVMVNEMDDCMLYLNGKAYSNIDESWADCILYLEDILSEFAKIKLRRLEEGIIEFPDVIEVYEDSYCWRKIQFSQVTDFIQKKTIKCVLLESTIIIEKDKNPPENIPFNAITNGDWYVLEN